MPVLGTVEICCTRPSVVALLSCPVLSRWDSSYSTGTGMGSTCSSHGQNSSATISFDSATVEDCPLNRRGRRCSESGRIRHSRVPRLSRMHGTAIGRTKCGVCRRRLRLLRFRVILLSWQPVASSLVSATARTMTVVALLTRRGRPPRRQRARTSLTSSRNPLLLRRMRSWSIRRRVFEKSAFKGRSCGFNITGFRARTSATLAGLRCFLTAGCGRLWCLLLLLLLLLLFVVVCL